MEPTIKITCDSCHSSYKVQRDDDAPENATSMGCNWCPKCEDTADDYYDEWYNDNDEDGDKNDGDPNQLLAFSIADDILQNHNLNIPSHAG